MICVECGRKAESLYRVHSPGNAELTRCGHCNKFADVYVEYEPVLVFIDLVLHKQQAYRHVLLNYFSLHPLTERAFLWWSACLVVIMDACRRPALGLGKQDSPLDGSWLNVLLWCFKIVGASLVSSVVLLFLVYGSLTCIFTTQACPHHPVRWQVVAEALSLSSFPKLLVVSMMVWQFSPAVALLVDVFVFTSNTVAIQVLGNIPLHHAAIISAISMATKAVCEGHLVGPPI